MLALSQIKKAGGKQADVLWTQFSFCKLFAKFVVLVVTVEGVWTGS
jgi:hypothetical protein